MNYCCEQMIVRQTTMRFVQGEPGYKNNKLLFICHYIIDRPICVSYYCLWPTPRINTDLVTISMTFENNNNYPFTLHLNA